MNSNPESQDVKKDLGNLVSSLGTFFSKLVDLQEGIDREGTIYWIKNNKRMRGANAWLLMCSIMIASLGLDMDSPAIIIGAMLISPLMSPILGVGLGIGTNDKESLIISLQHFGVSIAIALITSYIYFWINPLGQLNATKEIIDRTEPTLLAGIVAIFGGIAGIISASRKDQSNAIPGVAIATALMPPLCVAGYGIAHAEYKIFLNAFYLFFLNSFFIAISTFAFIRYMKFPVKAYQNQKESRRTTFLILLVSILLIFPSVLILRDVVRNKKRDQVVSSFVDTHFGNEKNPQHLGYSFTHSDTANILAIKLLGKQINESQVAEYEKLIAEAGVARTRIIPLQDETVDLKQFDKIQKEITGYQKIVNQLELSDNKMSKADERIIELTNRIDSLKQAKFPILIMNSNLKLIEEIDYVDFGQIEHPVDGKVEKKFVLFIKWNEDVGKTAKSNARKSLNTYLDGNYESWNIEIRDLN